MLEKQRLFSHHEELLSALKKGWITNTVNERLQPRSQGLSSSGDGKSRDPGNEVALPGKALICVPQHFRTFWVSLCQFLAHFLSNTLSRTSTRTIARLSERSILKHFGNDNVTLTSSFLFLLFGRRYKK